MLIPAIPFRCFAVCHAPCHSISFIRTARIHNTSLHFMLPCSTSCVCSSPRSMFRMAFISFHTRPFHTNKSTNSPLSIIRYTIIPLPYVAFISEMYCVPAVNICARLRCPTAYIQSKRDSNLFSFKLYIINLMMLIINDSRITHWFLSIELPGSVETKSQSPSQQISNE